MEHLSRNFNSLSFCCLVSIMLRSFVGQWGHSGADKPPMYGDFEAQRHWMEITTAIPIGEWYRNSTNNDLQYWGLDYPPLTAYISWIFGCIAAYLYPDLIEFQVSRGHESLHGKAFMRATVLLTDMLILLPSIYLLQKQSSLKKYASKLLNGNRISVFKDMQLLILLLCPASILIDHGHFQYNGMCIGLALLGAYAILNDQDILGSILYCLSLNFKQMGLYYAPVFFFGLLYKCLNKQTWILSFLHLIKIGLSVILSFICLWSPFCIFHATEETCISSLLQVLTRLFPFSRGIFEDKVANIWYSLSVIIDFRVYFTTSQLVHMSLMLTLLLLLPIAINLLRFRFTPERFILSLVISSQSFFLASFQV